jgi:hypothetical protein
VSELAPAALRAVAIPLASAIPVEIASSVRSPDLSAEGRAGGPVERGV